jgi:hypothetical protein
MDELFNNIFILIPIAVIAGLRLMEARRKRPPNRYGQGTPGFPAPELQENPERAAFFREEDDDDEKEARVFPQGLTFPVKSPPPPLVESLAPYGTVFPAVLAHESPPAENTGAPDLSAAGEAPRSGADKGLSPYLTRLPPLKRAVVWAEILGPPKALSPSLGDNIGE